MKGGGVGEMEFGRPGKCEKCGAERMRVRAFGDEFWVCSRDPKHDGWDFAPLRRKDDC